MAISVPTQLATVNSNAAGQTSWAPAGLVFPANSLGFLQIVLNGGGAHPTGISDGTNPWTNIPATNRSALSEDFVSEWYFPYVSGGTFTVTTSFASSNEVFGWIGYTTGADSAPLDTSGGNSSGGATSLAIAASSAMAVNDELSALVVGHSVAQAPTTWPTTNYSSLFNFNDGVRGFSGSGEYRIYSGSGSGVTESVTVAYATSNVLTGGIATFKPSAGAAAPAILAPAFNAIPFMGGH